VRIRVERCNLCVLPRTSRLIEFDEDGTCRLCRIAQRADARRAAADALEDIQVLIDRVKQESKEREYDCLVGISGGRDSTYLLHLLVRRHGLRCLAAYYRTPFTSDVTDANARKAVAQLNVPLVEIDISEQFHRRIAREMVSLWKERGDLLFINLACAPCKLVNREMFRIAQAYDVSTIIYGGNRHENFQLSAGQLRYTPDATEAIVKRQASFVDHLRRIVELGKRGGSTLGMSISLWRYIPLGFRASVMYQNPHTSYLGFRHPSIYAADYFYWTEWDEAECKRVCASLGWRLPPGCNSAWRSDCSFAELKNYMFFKTTGITYLDAYFSNMVRAGALSRDEALDRLRIEGQFSEQRLREACEVLSLPLNVML
jgi:glucosamine--fructose-6-phosphate aminotransferase (isomerizing)